MKDEYVGLLGRGIGTWNAWRAEHDEVPDLSSANLRALDLSGFDLSRVDLRRADLRGTKCCDTNLSGAHLEGANFFKAVLDGAFGDGGKEAIVEVDITGFNTAVAITSPTP